MVRAVGQSSHAVVYALFIVLAPNAHHDGDIHGHQHTDPDTDDHPHTDKHGDVNQYGYSVGQPLLWNSRADRNLHGHGLWSQRDGGHPGR